ncbi:MAG TPA: T9SS type A sorting domain-containing protein, partial [Chitinophagaceae bacterium]
VGNFTATTETFVTTVNDGMLNIFFSALTSDGGINRPEVTAIEILSSTGSVTVKTTGINETRQNVQSSIITPGIVYPNPSNDARFKVLFNEDIEGEVSYSLFSLSGNELTKGKLTLMKPTRVLDFNFFQQMQKGGMYYLQLKLKKGNPVFRLVRINTE